MSLEEMIAFLSGMRPAFPSGKLADLDAKIHAIIAAVRAGQAIRDSLGWMGSDDSLDSPVIEHDIKLALAMEAWDAVTSGEEKEC